MNKSLEKFVIGDTSTTKGKLIMLHKLLEQQEEGLSMSDEELKIIQELWDEFNSEG